MNNVTTNANPLRVAAIAEMGIVAIGRNEGERLRKCLESARRDVDHVMYVDSHSSDGSVALAQNLGVQVVELDPAVPFTAARARNAGFEHLMEVAPRVEFVQFVDGDCEIVSGWIAAARAAMAGDARLGVVCGRRRERFPEASVYNRLCDVEWNTPVGEARSCGGDALMRVSAFREVGGYDPSVIAGEEPELCVRLRQRGWKVRRIDAEMTLHDAAMTRFGQWWKRNVRAGHAYAEGAARHGRPPERHAVRQVRSNWIWGALFPLGTLALIVAFHAWGLLALVLYAALAIRVSRAARARGIPIRDARLYGIFVAMGKLPQAIGQLKYKWARLRGRRSTLIEYKAGPNPIKPVAVHAGGSAAR